MKKTVFDKISAELNAPAIELYSNKRVIVCDCVRVDDYADGYILLELRDYFLKVSGDGLIISSYVFGQADIVGTIVSVEFLSAGNS